MNLTFDQLQTLVRELSHTVLELEGRIHRLEHTRATTPRQGPHVSGSQTSKRAAERNTPRSGTQRHQLLTYLVTQGTHGATREQAADALGMSHNSARPRLGELLEDGYLTVTNRTRKTTLGEDAEVLAATDLGREVVLKTVDVQTTVSPAPVAPGVPDALFEAPRAPARNAINDSMEEAA